MFESPRVISISKKQSFIAYVVHHLQYSYSLPLQNKMEDAVVGNSPYTE
jgi:hypothetical protein